MTLCHPEKKLFAKGMCRPCYNRQWYASSPQAKQSQRNNKLLKRYGITLIEYNRLFELQGGKCAVCGDADKELIVEHRHDDNFVRGLTCQRCNVIIAAIESPLRPNAERFIKEAAWRESVEVGDYV